MVTADDNRRQVFKHGGVAAVQLALEKYPGVPDMYHWGCGILLNLARDRGPCMCCITCS